MSELLQVGDYVRWDPPNAGSYYQAHGGNRLLEVFTADSEYVGVVYEDTQQPVLDGQFNFYHHRFKKENKFLILAHKAIQQKEKHGT